MNTNRSSWRNMFFVALFFVTLSAFVFWIDRFKGTETIMRVIVVGKSVAVDEELISNNLAAIVETGAFYDRLISENPALSAPDEMPTEQKKKRGTLVDANRRQGTSIIEITAKSDSREESREMARASTKSLIAQSSVYYDIEKDIDLRIIDGPESQTVIVRPIRYVSTSLLTGIAVTGIFFMILSSVYVLMTGKRKLPLDEKKTNGAPGNGLAQDAMPFIDPKKFIPSKPSALSYETPASEEKRASKKIRSSFSTAPAPSNLPIADKDSSVDVDTPLPFEFEEVPPPSDQDLRPQKEEVIENLPYSQSDETDDESQTEQSVRHETSDGQSEPDRKSDETGSEPNIQSAEPRESSSPDREPTVEEYKRRLNELLKGE